jgi:hypothetical protein
VVVTAGSFRRWAVAGVTVAERAGRA